MPAPILTLYPSKAANQEGRSYKVPGSGVDSVTPAVTYPSITTILKQADKSGLVQWAVGLTLDAVNRNPDMVFQRSDQDMKRHFQYAWTRVRDERGEVGTGIHETIEALHTGTQRFPFLNDEQMRIMKHWDALNFEHEIVPVYTEFTVYDPTVEFMGTADGLWFIDGVLTLTDIKTSKNTWPEHKAQLAALKKAPLAFVQCEESDPGALRHVGSKGVVTWWKAIANPALEADAVAIVHLREDKHEIIPIENIDLHWEVFKGYAKVHHAKAELKSIENAAKLAAEETEVTE